MQNQQDFLNTAMQTLGLSPEEFCIRFGCPRRTLDRWLLASTDPNACLMSDEMWSLVRELLAHQKSKPLGDKLKTSD